ncbi:MAG: HEAT repeat domain-containing protein [Phycisphaerae bacterium]
MGARRAKRGLRWLGLAVVCALGVGPSVAENPPTTQSAGDDRLLAPPEEILRLWQSDDPESHIEGFAAWHPWRSTLDAPRRRAANRFLARDEWFDVLAHEVLYDMEGPRRRLTAYKLMRRLGGQRRFPYFLWGIEVTAPHRPPPASLVFFALDSMLTQSGYLKHFFERYGDRTVLTHLPDRGGWSVVKRRIRSRWKDVEGPPHQTWKPLKVEDFEADLSHDDPARRRLAIRALTNHRRCEGIARNARYRVLLADSDETVRLAAALALSIRACPEARGRLKRMVENPRERMEVRRAALYAVARCGKAPVWTAEWMIGGLPEWPEALDDAVKDCLVRLCPEEEMDRLKYVSFLDRLLERMEGDRERRVTAAAAREMEP